MTLTRRTPLKRSPLKAKRTGKPRRLPAVQCSFQRCHNRPRAAGFCPTHLQREADRVFSLFVRARDGACTARDMFPQTRCNGALQAMHLASRRYHAVRWDERNVHAGCAAHHVMLTYKPLEHLQFCESFVAWPMVRDQALHGEPQDPADIVVQYGEVAA